MENSTNERTTVENKSAIFAGVVVPRAGENLPTAESKSCKQQECCEFRSQQKSPLRRMFGFCLEFSCGDGCCCCI